MTSPQPSPAPATPHDARRSLWFAAMVGAGVMAGIDEIVFHQLLQWHHFFDHATPTIGILSDGLLHAAELLAIVIGAFLLVDLAQRRRLAARWAWAGFFLGMGGFQLFDGIVSHKILRIHQIRYGVDLLVYDLTWNLTAVALLLVGVALYRRARRRERG
ncbi:MAG: DUF2243 domain-containing protein [Halomonas sp.]|jgi:uncharacterized membrane protein|uniref:DUF2243 domain-containing protein n=1 Tax=Billgrantia tianxiuensis TaxID=2497861 RepID=A0A6I6SF81_9GAMM|nr:MULTISPECIES: DUF2243 domain-containing protein [Halomonas]MCE8032827.1 DUF2243 domain-containing protein [Halomonas sp. MCCC 1A11057]MDX5434705.1 DUF2243 domain-containing protein [Halomonas sp.]MDX5504123.1 DUF2243 domain-containing protein [Halomonas sp.]QHC49288.1 DUF2243 domain-containing protein [Halomonas tianxiuensis]